MQKILVAVDGSAVADRAVRYAIELTRCIGECKIILLNVQQTLEHWYKGGLLNEEALKHLRQQGEDRSASARELLTDARLLYDFKIVFGLPAEVIVRVANEEACSMIVMGTRGLGAIENVFLGSTAYKVIQLAEMPVTLVK